MPEIGICQLDNGIEELARVQNYSGYLAGTGTAQERSIRRSGATHPKKSGVSVEC